MGQNSNVSQALELPGSAKKAKTIRGRSKKKGSRRSTITGKMELIAEGAKTITLEVDQNTTDKSDKTPDLTINSDDIKQIVEQQEEEIKTNNSISPVDFARNLAGVSGASKLVTELTKAATNAVLGHSYLSASVPKAENIASYLQHLQAQTKTNKNRPQNRSEKRLQ